ncbi:uncharacterized protein N7506_010195 [Penicillium brevicompactum]|uniref:uncharacterized protein n=1 Tax=Penicillium brevicompactum TaxID=5074 RepID=UPI00253F65B7|nr:uncharacterized protein N7506_010195 [Penicillium brevicompactum]KAJ5327093.1 hypothetical protein N7506_010195 [Penicillium brevicompactum]
MQRREHIGLKGKLPIMDIHKWAETKKHLDLLGKYIAVLVRAAQKTGQPFENFHPHEILGYCQLRWEERRLQKYRDAVEISFASARYQPCATPFEELNKVMIKDLRCEIRSLDSYILVRKFSETNRRVEMSARLMIVQDEDGNLVVLEIPPEAFDAHSARLEKEMMLLVKQPSLRYIEHGVYQIKVDHVSDIAFIAACDEMVPLRWRQGGIQNISEWSADQWLDKVNQQRLVDAHGSVIAWCTEALKELSMPDSDLSDFLFHRSFARFRMKQHQDALDDINRSIGSKSAIENHLRIKTAIFYGAQMYQDCIDTLKKLLEIVPGDVNILSGIEQTEARIAEQEHGVYDFKVMQDKARPGMPIPTDQYASYQGPVVVKESNLRGRGMFTTKAVKAGELLLCEKAIAYLRQPSPGVTNFYPRMPRLIYAGIVNLHESIVYHEFGVALARETIVKMAQSDSVRAKVLDLHSGNFPKNNIPDDKSVDTFLIMHIAALNSFGSPYSSIIGHGGVSPEDGASSLANLATCHGIWHLASFINHSCESNVYRSFIGDVMIVRAARDLDADTEIGFWYTIPDRVHGVDTSHWDFACSCVICTDVRSTEPGVLTMREALRTQLDLLMTEPDLWDQALLNRKMTELSETYVKPPTEVPHYAVWDKQLSAARLFVKWDNYPMALEFTLCSLESLGFVIEGYEPRGEKLVVSRWGVMVVDVVEAWVMVYLSCLRTLPELAPSAYHYAKLCFLICVGEDSSFDETYGVVEEVASGMTEMSLTEVDNVEN